MVLAENLVMLRNVKRHDTGTGRRGHRDFQTVLRKMGAGRDNA